MRSKDKDKDKDQALANTTCGTLGTPAIPYAQPVSYFHSKHFEGIEYTLGHLDPFTVTVPLDAAGTKAVEIHVTFGCHCFTETFESPPHLDHHRYTFRGETRAFDVQRHACSLQLPAVINAMFAGRVHWAEQSYTYVANIVLGNGPGAQAYSVFFGLERDTSRPGALKLFVKSAYLKPLVARKHAQAWRFKSLAGQVAGVFEKAPKTRPRKKAP